MLCRAWRDKSTKKLENLDKKKFCLFCNYCLVLMSSYTKQNIFEFQKNSKKFLSLRDGPISACSRNVVAHFFLFVKRD